MRSLSEETINLLTAMVLLSTLIIVVGDDVRQVKIHVEEVKSQTCYQRVAVNSGNGSVYGGRAGLYARPYG